MAYFDTAISYESLAVAIKSEVTARSAHRADLMMRAIEQARSAYALVTDLEATALWQRIYDICSAEFRDLKMKPPGQKGSQSTWVIFKADLPRRITIDWKIVQGTVDLSFWKGAANSPPQEIDLSSLGVGVSFERLGNTVAIRVPVTRPPAEWTNMTDDVIRNGLEAALQLLRFYARNRPAFQQWL